MSKAEKVKVIDLKTENKFEVSERSWKDTFEGAKTDDGQSLRYKLEEQVDKPVHEIVQEIAAATTEAELVQLEGLSDDPQVAEAAKEKREELGNEE